MSSTMMDTRLRTACLWIAVAAGMVSIAALMFAPMRSILYPATIFVGGTAAVLFLRMLLSRVYRHGIHATNREMGLDAKTFGDPDWGLFGRRVGTPTLLWVRAILFIGLFPAVVLQNWTGVDFAMLWFWGGFVAIELSIMHTALSQSAT